MNPFKVLYGRNPPPQIRYELNSAANVEMDTQLIQHDAILALIAFSSSSCSKKDASHHNGKLHGIQFAV